jgi:hypothetical protein
MKVDKHVFHYKGFICEIVKHPALGHLCGYVDIPKGHQYFGIEPDEIHVDVHGGITFTNFIANDIYRIGFDCAHIGDYVPEAMLHFPGQHYWTFDEVAAETKRLVDQLVQVKAETKTSEQ